MATLPNYYARSLALQRANQGAFGSYGAYLSPDLGKEWQWDSFAVGIASMASTMCLGLATAGVAMPQKKGKKSPSPSRAITPFVLPAVAAGVLGYLLRWNMNKSCVCNGNGQPETTVTQLERTRYQTPLNVTAETVQDDCPPGWQMTPDGCQELI
jgi:hypothetical protein